jgi:Flp pilus assembly protein TadG
MRKNKINSLPSYTGLKSRRRKGQSLIEVMLGLLVIIPIGLAAVDIVVLTNASQNNEEIAGTAARAASTQGNAAGATNAVEQIVQRVSLNNVVQSVDIDDVNFDLGRGTVSVSLIMTVKMPIPFFSFNTISCKASAIQPIVSTPAPR